MKSKIPILLFISGSMVHAPLHAEEPRMVVNTSQGNPVEIELSTATRITFSEDLSTMTVKGEDDDVSIDIDDISNIMFTIDSSVDNVAQDINGLKISSRGPVVTIAGAGPIEYLAVDMSGSPQFAGQSRDNVTLDFLSKVPVGYTASEHVVKAQMYDAPDTYYGVPTEIGIPGEDVYLFVNVEEGYKPMTATTDDGKTFNFVYYGPNHAGLPYYCPVTISEGAASMTASVNCEKAWTISSEQVVEFGNGGVYAADETVNFAMQVPAGKQIDTVKAVTASGTEVPVTLDLPYGTLVMPGEDVTVTVTYSDLTAGDTVTVIADYDQDQYGVNSSTNYDWDFAEGFTMDKGATFYLSVIDYYGENFYVGVKVGETVTVYPAVQDEDSGEYSFGKAIVADGNVIIKVRASESAITF